MKYRHVFWALILIAIGTLFMLNNFGVIDFGFRALWSLWPLILILWGISILPIKDWMKVVGLVAILALTVIFFERITERSFWWRFDHFDYSQHDHDWDDENRDESNYQPQNLSVPYDTLIQRGELKLDAAAGNFNIEGMTSDMLSFSKSGDIGNYSLTTNDDGARKSISLSLEKSGVRHNISDNKVEIKLNEKPSWNLDFDIGAAEIDMDLRDYRVDTITVDAGASSIDMKIGDKSALSIITFNAGASSITVEIPKSSGCQIKSESFMISKEFEGFTKKGEGLYETAGFASSPKKIYLTVKTAISKIEIIRY
jgi:hypothetical protein